MRDRMSSRITVDGVLTQWEKEYKIVLAQDARDMLLFLFTEIVDKAVDITIEETMKKFDEAVASRQVH